jgi:hypothetical protein
MNELIELNYKKPKRLDLMCFIGCPVTIIRHKIRQSGIVTKVWWSKHSKEEIIKIEYDFWQPRIMTEYTKKEFEREIMNGKLKIYERKTL